MKVDLFDFDKTVYRGDCSFDFYIYCLRYRPQIARFLPVQLWHWALYWLGAEDRVSVRSTFFHFLKEVDNVERHTQKFWQKNRHKITFPHSDQRHDIARIIISASPEFLLSPLAKEIDAKLIIATQVDMRSGKLTSSYCYGHEKVVRFLAEARDATVRAAYSDSLSDLPMLQLADKAYIVRRHKVIPLERYLGTPLLSRLFV